MASGVPLRISVAPHVKESLQAWSDVYGLPLSSMAAYVLGQWVYNQESITKPMQAKLTEAGADAMNVGMKQMVEMFEEMMMSDEPKKAKKVVIPRKNQASI